MNPAAEAVAQLMREYDRAPERLAVELARLVRTSPDAQTEVALAIIELLDNPGADWQTGLTVLGDSGSPTVRSLLERAWASSRLANISEGARDGIGVALSQLGSKRLRAQLVGHASTAVARRPRGAAWRLVGALASLDGHAALDLAVELVLSDPVYAFSSPTTRFEPLLLRLADGGPDLPRALVARIQSDQRLSPALWLEYIANVTARVNGEAPGPVFGPARELASSTRDALPGDEGRP